MRLIGQGEQDAAHWFKEKHQEDEIDVSFMPVDVRKECVATETTLTALTALTAWLDIN